MLRIIVPEREDFDEETNSFIAVGGIALDLEHSLVSLSKWESKFEKPFLSQGKKSTAEVLAYVKMMIVTPNIPPEVFSRLSQDNFAEINDYIDSKQSATTFGQMPKYTGKRETITSELIYYWMFSFNIPLECESWHLNRLFSLIRICNAKNSKPQKMSAKTRRELNAQRKAALGTTG